MYGDPTTCRVCGHNVPRSGYPRYYCCNGDMCGCGGGTLPDNVCSSSCLENEDSLVPLEVLEDDEPPEPDGECFRGGEAAAYEAEQMAQWQRLK